VQTVGEWDTNEKDQRHSLARLSDQVTIGLRMIREAMLSLTITDPRLGLRRQILMIHAVVGLAVIIAAGETFD